MARVRCAKHNDDPRLYPRLPEESPDSRLACEVPGCREREVFILLTPDEVSAYRDNGERVFEWQRRGKKLLVMDPDPR